MSADFEAICVSTGKTYTLDGAVARAVKNEGGRRFSVGLDNFTIVYTFKGTQLFVYSLLNL